MTVASRVESRLLSVRLSASAPLRLFCFPYAGAGAQVYFPWARALAVDVEVWAFQPPGRGTRTNESPLRAMAPLAREAVETIVPHTGGAFALFGHSMGALLAFEVARQLRADGARPPAHLFLSGTGAPHLPPLATPIHQLPREQFVDKLRSFSGTPPAVFEHEELLDIILPTLRADFEACDRYHCAPDSPLDVPITVYGGLEDVEAPREYLEAWRQHTTATCAVRTFPGGHFFLHSSSDVVFPALTRDLRAVMAEQSLVPDQR